MLKYQFWKNVTSEKWNSDQLTTFTTYLSSLLGVIAIVFSNHAQKWGQICCESGQLVRVLFFRNPYFRNPTGRASLSFFFCKNGQISGISSTKRTDYQNLATVSSQKVSGVPSLTDHRLEKYIKKQRLHKYTLLIQENQSEIKRTLYSLCKSRKWPAY